MSAAARSPAAPAPDGPTGTGGPIRTGRPTHAGGPAPVAVHDLTVRYGTATAVDNVTLEVPAGGWTALVGPNGAGKTSLLHALSGAVPCTGRVLVGDDDLSALSPRARARRVALVPQRPVIPSRMSVASYVLLGRTAHLPYLGVEGAADREIVADTLSRLGLEPLAARTVATLSGGEQQRVVLARALVQHTPVLLLDEPTAALDVGHRQQVLELVDMLRRDCRLTVLAAMHDLTLAGQYADRMVVVDRGRVAAAGTPAEVLTTDRVATHFGADVHVLSLPDGGLAVVPTRRRT